jgi:hypothetical protein
VLLKDFAHNIVVANIPLYHPCFTSKCAAINRGLLGTFSIRVVANGHVRSRFGQPERDSASNPTIGAGDHSHFAVHS